jgi:hypothetical protein
MSVQTIPWPNAPAWEQTITLDEVEYIFAGRFVVSPLVPSEFASGEGYWVFDILDSERNPLEVGLKVVPGVRFGFRSALETLPPGVLVLSTLGTADNTPDVPSYDDMTQEGVILFYDSTL